MRLALSDESAISRLSLGPGQQWWIGLACTYLAFFLLMDAKLWRPGVMCDGSSNVQVTEAQQWWHGRLDLPERVHDTALHDGKVFSHFPILFTLISLPFVKVWPGVPHGLLVLSIALPLPGLAFALFRRLTPSGGWSVVLAAGLFAGTSAWPVLHRALRGCEPYFVNHGLATIGLLIFHTEYFGRRRIGVAGAGLVISALSRPMTSMFVLPLGWMVWRRLTGGGELMQSDEGPSVSQATGESNPGRHQSPNRSAAHQGRRSIETRTALVTFGLTCVVIWGVPMTMNFLKYGNPLESGYRLIYEGRDDYFATDARAHGLFSTAFLSRNLYWHNIGLPNRTWITSEGRPELHFKPNTVCTGLWWTSPVLLWLFALLPLILRDPATRWLMVAAAVVYGGLMLFHASGNVQRGYNRFSLDYLPALMAVIAPYSVSGWRRWVTIGLVVWSVVYYQWMA